MRRSLLAVPIAVLVCAAVASAATLQFEAYLDGLQETPASRHLRHWVRVADSG